MRHIKIRGRDPVAAQPYPLNEIPAKVIHDVGRHIVHFKAMGNIDWKDGDIFSRMFADSIGGESLQSPLGVADVVYKNCAWSVKTIKNNKPHEVKKVRLISGRNSPHYSANIENPNTDVEATGRAVIDVYNERIAEAKEQYESIRMLVLIRNMEDLTFALYERPLEPYAANNYKWSLNKNRNFVAYTQKTHAFTWQPHGGQFTILEAVPPGATYFHIDQKINPLKMELVLDMCKFDESLIKII